ncbi:hypothetical protein M8C21_000901 [Ambrosia artemisiifolia]|uniref:AIR9-like A9 domain-containing protein n=1 Tax=Ambrosia artemisiifolia TaxID=4212 RepID=A0AAD5BNI9_AMBAR|nr:hypothetical protein M8C21_000901 [Ambrosia artemisiifolia]
MASQPRLQVLAASKNKVSTLKGFPSLPSLESSVLCIVFFKYLIFCPYLSIAEDLSPKEIAIAKHYPAHTAVCIAGGWEFCSSKQALESTFNFLVEQWKDHFPPGYMLMEASVDQPFEEDACNCHFLFTKDKTVDENSELVLNYQWFIGSTTLSNFTPIPDATAEVYWPKRDDVGKILRVECTPVLGDTKYTSIFAISSPVSPGTTYTPSLEDVGAYLALHWVPTRADGKSGQPVVSICNNPVAPGFPVASKVSVKALSLYNYSGEGIYFGGYEGSSIFSWFRENMDRTIVPINGANSKIYEVTDADYNCRLMFGYTPVRSDSVVGELTMSEPTDVILPGCLAKIQEACQIPVV